VVSFSGDKVLGGPQAGIIVGKAVYISRIKKNPLNRALRIDKMTLAALEATLRIYKDPEQALRRVPTLRMICATADELRARATRLARRLKKALYDKAKISSTPGFSLVGGGSFPERYLPTSLVYISTSSVPAKDLRQRLLQATIPLVVRLEDDQLCLDVRTLSDAEFVLVEQALKEALNV
jgi:L-seryl-tRNA(Ser) seleniumtransferase